MCAHYIEEIECMSCSSPGGCMGCINIPPKGPKFRLQLVKVKDTYKFFTCLMTDFSFLFHVFFGSLVAPPTPPFTKSPGYEPPRHAVCSYKVISYK